MGLIVPGGLWVLLYACRHNTAWMEVGLAAEYLEIEITESVVMQNAPAALATLDKLSRMGIHLAVDDFGTGYSSLSYLKRFPLNTLKIDASFIRDLSRDNNDALIVQAIIALAHSLRLQVVAEGVEDATQLGFLQKFGSDQYQGFLHSKPLPAAEFARLLRFPQEPAIEAAPA
jgi:EAL domain-containing protein (putative c-di-GMP-specific phosphodiesterase class I)